MYGWQFCLQPRRSSGKRKVSKISPTSIFNRGERKIWSQPTFNLMQLMTLILSWKSDQVQGLHQEWLMGWGFLTLKIKRHIQTPNFLLADCYALIFLKYTASASCWVYEYIAFEWLSTLQVGMAFFMHDKPGGGHQPKPESYCKASCSGYTSSTFPTIDHCLNKSSLPFEIRSGTEPCQLAAAVLSTHLYSGRS